MSEQLPQREKTIDELKHTSAQLRAVAEVHVIRAAEYLKQAHQIDEIIEKKLKEAENE